MVFDDRMPVDAAAVTAALNADNDITHVGVIHCETTTGLLNPLESVQTMTAYIVQVSQGDTPAGTLE